MKTAIFIACLIGGALLLLAASAQSQQSACGKTDGMTQALKTRYGETLLVSGKTTQGNTMRIFFNTQTKTWTLTMEGNNTMCFVTAGKGMTFPGKPEGQEL